jgi:hypothetical protein
MNSRPIPIPTGSAAGLDLRWQEIYATGQEFGTAAPRLRNLADVELRAGPIFGHRGFLEGLRARHEHLGADPETLESIDALGDGAACVITGQQPHLLTGPFYTAWKILGTIVLARRLSELHGQRVVPVYWCGSDDSDFDEVSSAWLFDVAKGPWRIDIPRSEHVPGAQIGGLAKGRLAALEQGALGGLHGPGLDWFRDRAEEIPDTGLADRASAWVLRQFAASGLVVVDARDHLLLSEARPLLERYAAMRGEVARAVDARVAERVNAGWSPALDPAARLSGVFALRDGRREKLSADDLDSGAAARWSWGPSVLLRPVVQDSLLAPVAAVLGPGELRYHAEIEPVYRLLGVEAARPVPRPHATLVGGGWEWPEADPGAVGRILGGGGEAAAELARLQLPDTARSALDKFSSDLGKALEKLESGLETALNARTRARFEREIRRLRASEADRRGGHVRRDAEWMARGRTPQERLYSSWLLWAWCEDPLASVLEPIGGAWLDAVDRGGAVQWVLPVEGIR